MTTSGFRSPIPAVQFAAAGELIEIEGFKYMLWSDCGRPTSTLACITCGQYLANQGQLEMHAETADHSTHRLAAWCGTHGWEAIRR